MISEEMSCQIQWIDASGKKTPDNNIAVGEAYIIEHVEYSSSYMGGRYAVDESRHFLICAEHLKRLREPGMKYWRFEPYKNEVE